jgi:hypothetical protein
MRFNPFGDLPAKLHTPLKLHIFVEQNPLTLP